MPANKNARQKSPVVERKSAANADLKVVFMSASLPCKGDNRVGKLQSYRKEFFTGDCRT